MTAPDTSEWLTPEQVAAKLPGAVTAWWIRKELNAGRIDGSKWGHRWFIHRDAIAAVMEANSNQVKARKRRKRAS